MRNSFLNICLSSFRTTWLNSVARIYQVDNATSDTGPVSAGVPQGSIIGPLLFIIFTADMSEAVLGPQVLSLQITCSSKAPQAVLLLQRAELRNLWTGSTNSIELEGLN